ncbi:uncharacterized protein LOC112201174 [Rosa chinensis]|uniref:uncharacterized protein LOC112201174 n=1 Tax=Rosa chinensis TaxID=74649 RepID=UPI000D094A9F|nr:uncharacterized protein LOC112201174 [Rosa chinensis]
MVQIAKMQVEAEIKASAEKFYEVNWSTEYEKLNEDSPPPNKYLDFVLILK